VLSDKKALSDLSHAIRTRSRFATRVSLELQRMQPVLSLHGEAVVPLRNEQRRLCALLWIRGIKLCPGSEPHPGALQSAYAACEELAARCTSPVFTIVILPYVLAVLQLLGKKLRAVSTWQRGRYSCLQIIPPSLSFIPHSLPMLPMLPVLR
jgi:hypothetical protein